MCIKLGWAQAEITKKGKKGEILIKSATICSIPYYT